MSRDKSFRWLPIPHGCLLIAYSPTACGKMYDQLYFPSTGYPIRRNGVPCFWHSLLLLPDESVEMLRYEGDQDGFEFWSSYSLHNVRGRPVWTKIRSWTEPIEESLIGADVIR